MRSYSTQLTILAVLAVIGFLLLARAVFIPIAIAMVASYALAPVVSWLESLIRMPRALGAALTLGFVVAVLGAGIVAVQPQAMHILDLVPQATQKFTATFKRGAYEPPGAVEKIQKAATEIERAANNVATPAPETSKAPAPSPKAPDSSLNVGHYIFMGSASLAAGMGQLVAIIALAYLLLAAGDRFRRSLLKVAGETLSDKKRALQILDEIDFQVQRYLLVQVVASALLSVVAWIAFMSLGLENALFWACLGGVLHLVPYVGPAAWVVAVGIVSFAQFDDPGRPVYLVGTATALLVAIGMFLVPLLTQKVGKLNAVAVFVALLFWGWLWGVWGLLLGVPIVMAINAVCERVSGLHPIAEFLGMPKTESA